MMTTQTASPAFVDALKHQADRIRVNYKPGQGVFDRYNGERLDTPGDVISLFHALDLPYIAPQHRNWSAVIDMIRGGNLVAPKSTRPIYMLNPSAKPADDKPILENPRRTIDYETNQRTAPQPRRLGRNDQSRFSGYDRSGA